MNIIRKLFGGLSKEKYLTPTQAINIRFFGGQLVPYSENKLMTIQKGYKGNDIIYSIIKLITTTAKIAPWGVYKIVDEDAYKEYKAELSKVQPDFKLAAELRQKSLEVYKGNTKLNKLLERPNKKQTLSRLHEELWTFKLTTGDYYEYWQLPTGGLDAKIPNSISALPSQNMDIESTTTLPLEEAAYYLRLGQMVKFTPEEILHESYTNLEWDTFGTQLYGMSPLTPSLPRLQRNNESQRAGAVAQANGGMRGIAYYDDERLDPNDDKTFEQMGKQKKTFREEMRPGVDGTGHVMWSQYKVGYQQLGFSPKDLESTDQELADLRQFCNTYGVPSQLLNDPAAKTYNTVTEAEKALITRACLPLLCDRRDSLNMKLDRTDNIIVDFDLSVYDQLQPNKKQIAEWANTMPIPNARKLELVGEDVPEWWTEEQRRAVLVPAGQQNLDDVLLPMPEDQSDDVNKITARGLNPL